MNLIGDCQGGWLATIYAALYPERVNTLTIAGAPIDFHAGEPVIHEVVRRVAPDGDLRFYEALVAMDGGVLEGRHMLSGFILIQPGAEISRQIELLLNLDDPAHVARYREFEDWFKHTQDVPGAFYLWIVRNLFRDNGLISGSLEVRGQKVDLRRHRHAARAAGRGHRPHHPARPGLRAGHPGVDAGRAGHPARLDRRPPRAVHGPRGAARALAADAHRGVPELPRG